MLVPDDSAPPSGCEDPLARPDVVSRAAYPMVHLITPTNEMIPNTGQVAPKSWKKTRFKFDEIVTNRKKTA